MAGDCPRPWSLLTGGAPVRAAVVVTLAAGADRLAAARAGAAGLPIDAPHGAAAVERLAHQRCGVAEGLVELAVCRVGDPAPRRHPRAPERLRLPDVPDAGHEPLVEQRVAELASRLAAEQRDDRVEVGRVGEDVRAEPLGAALAELEHRAVPEHGLALGTAQHEPRTPGSRRPARLDAPAARHAQVAAEDEPALELEQDVLAHGADGLELLAVEPLGQCERRGAGMRRLDLDPLPDEHLEPPRRAVERVAFGH